jgi:subtilisin-like proprotein convertase family protein
MAWGVAPGWTIVAPSGLRTTDLLNQTDTTPFTLRWFTETRYSTLVVLEVWVVRKDRTEAFAEQRKGLSASPLQRDPTKARHRQVWRAFIRLVVSLLIVGLACRSDSAHAGDNGPTPTVTPPGSVAFCQSPGVVIPDFDPAGVNDSIVISDDFSIADLDVYIRITHFLVGDLVATLTHLDSGTTVTLMDRPGDPAQRFGCKAPDIDVVLDDEATDPIEDECEQTIPTIAGTLSPNEPLGHFDSESAHGTWTLNVKDVELADEGTLDEWCLVYKSGVPETPTVTGTIAPTQTETATPGPTDIPTAAHTTTPTPSQTANASQTPTAPQATPSHTPTVFQTPSASHTPTLDGSPTPTNTHTVGFPTDTPTAEDTPSPTPPAQGTPTPIGVPCTGDCNLDQKVTVDELVVTVRIALGQLPMTQCPAADANEDGSLTIEEPVSAVDHSLNGCPGAAVSR